MFLKRYPKGVNKCTNLESRDHFVYAPSQWETRYNVTSSLIGWAHTQNDYLKYPWYHILSVFGREYNSLNSVTLICQRYMRKVTYTVFVNKAYYVIPFKAWQDAANNKNVRKHRYYRQER